MSENVRLVHEGPHHAVLYKPEGMVVVAGRGVPRPTLLDVAVSMFGPQTRPVHRIDRATQGLCIVAKSPFGQQALSDAFRRHLVDKRYACIVEGHPDWTKRDVDFRLARVDDPDAHRGPLAWQTVDPEGVRALTRLRVLAQGPRAALLEARPETGRMHQIRCHCAHIGHPLLGDTLYGATVGFGESTSKAATDAPAKPKATPRAIALCAVAVSFPLPQGGRAFVTAPPSQAFAKALSDEGLKRAALDTMLAAFAQVDTERQPPKPQRPTKPTAGKKPEARGKPAKATTPRGPRGPHAGPGGAARPPRTNNAQSAQSRRGDRRGR